jgi:hypothetical protein
MPPTPEPSKNSYVNGLVPSAAVFRSDWIMRAISSSMDKSINGFVAEWITGK